MAVDARSHIFSLGTVLYGMLTGKRAFPGTSAASAFGALLHRDPDPSTPPTTMAAVVLKASPKTVFNAIKSPLNCFKPS